ncbi:MAG: 50S ribosomal protein L20 [Candidatus Omnitrophica bacterium]|nr:50S ribosomal protein L20 [Candidatus Omnitrophota bacterium]
MRATRSPASRKRKKKVLKSTKGYWGKRSKVYRRALETLRRAYVYAYRDRKRKKREFRRLWITRINAGVREKGITYHEFINGLRKKNILLSRDILANLACEENEVFDRLIEIAKGS